MFIYFIVALGEVRITDILIITSPQHVISFINSLGDGMRYCVHFTYMTKTTPKGYNNRRNLGKGIGLFEEDMK